MAKKKIVLDADVIINFSKVKKLFLLTSFLPNYDFIILDIVYNEINEKIRIEIDNIDRQLLRLLAQRQILVEKAGRLKPKGDKVAVQASDRVAQVIANRRKEALELGLSPDVAESVWRSMIKAFIALEEKVNKE